MTALSTPLPPLATRYAAARPRRVWLLMAAVWLMNGFDLVLTLHAHEQGLLTEANPVAHAALALGPVIVISFKIGLVGFGSLVLLHYRRRCLVECMAWMVTAVYLIVSIHWMQCCEQYLNIVAYRVVPPLVPGTLG